MTSRPSRRLARSLAVLALALPLLRCTTDGERVAATPLAISPGLVELRVGESAQLGATGATGVLTWTTTDAGVATVDFGRVQATGAGIAIIVAAEGITTARATVTVTRPPLIAPASGGTSFAVSAGGALPAAQTIAIANGGDHPVEGLAVGGVAYTPAATGWLVASLDATTAPATLTLRPGTTSLPSGTHTATVSLTSTTAANSPVPLTVTYVVAAPPVIVPSAPGAMFAATQGAALPAARTIGVTNGGGGALAGLAAGGISYSGGASGWLTAAIAPGTAPATLTLRPATTSLPAGTHTATVPIVSTTGAAPVAVTVTYVVAAGPQIVLSSGAAAFSARQTAALPAAQTIAVTNGGGGALAGLAVGAIAYDAGASGWLAASVSPTTAPATLTLRPTSAAMAPGTYTATVPLTATGAGVAPASVRVTYTITTAPAPPSIVLSATALSATVVRGAPAPPAQTVSVTNGGEGTLTGLAAAVEYVGAGGWLQITGAPGSSAPTSISVQPGTTDLAPGTYVATVRITSPVAGNSPRTITYSYTVRAPATIALSAAALDFTAVYAAAAPAARSVSITNDGDVALTGLAASVEHVGTSGWLQITSAPAASAPTSVAVRPASTTLAPGTYVANVRITSPVASNSPRIIVVTYTVQPLPLSAVFGILDAARAGGGSTPCSACHAGSGGSPPPLSFAGTTAAARQASFYNSAVGQAARNAACGIGSDGVRRQKVRPGSPANSCLWYFISVSPASHPGGTIRVSDAPSILRWIEQGANP